LLGRASCPRREQQRHPLSVSKLYPTTATAVVVVVERSRTRERTTHRGQDSKAEPRSVNRMACFPFHPASRAAQGKAIVLSLDGWAGVPRCYVRAVTVLRPYLSADAAACCDVINAALLEMDGLNAPARVVVKEKNVPAILDRELGTTYTLVAEDRGRICGVSCLFVDEIKRLYVTPTAQRQGLGRALVAALEQEARRRKLSEIRVDASPSSIGFYERIGFVLVRVDDFRRGEATFRFAVMTKQLIRLAG
jgi:GNAT superfamily N-acetyltransferase